MSESIKTAEISPRLKATLLGAGLGGTVGGVWDWATRPKPRRGEPQDSPWDGALAGALLGGWIGNRGSQLHGLLADRPDPLNRKHSTTTLAEHLPPGYRDEAQAAAQAYRKLRPDIDWKERITDAAIDRNVPVVVGPVGDISGTGAIAASAAYDPNVDQILLPDHTKTRFLPHELTHAAQKHETLAEEARQPLPSHTRPVSRLIPGSTLDSVQEAAYLTDPQEEEAYLADIKRKYYQGTGQHVRTPEEARTAIDWRMQNIRRGENVPLMDARLQQSQRNSKLKEPREEWIKTLIQRMPGLVQNESLDLSKTANYPGANTMNPTPNMGGFMGGLPAGNNFSRTFQPGMPPLPQKPNPLAAATPVQSMKADANGIQTAMAKRGSQDNSAKRTSATGESDGVGYKLDDDGHTTGGSAFGTLDKYMKKAGLNSFQAQFFGRMIQAGLDEGQLRQAVKQAHVQFGPQVAQELAVGLEKLAINMAKATELMGRAGGAVRGGINFARGLAGAKSLRNADTLADMTGAASRAASPAFATGQKLNFGVRNQLRPLTRPVNKLLKNKDIAQGLATGAFNPYTGLTSAAAQNEDGSTNFGRVLGSTVLGGLAGKGLGKTQFADAARRVQRQSLAGSNLVTGTGMVANMAGSDVDTTRAAQLAGLGAAFLPRKLTAIPGVRNLATNVKIPAGIRSSLAGHTDEALTALRPDQFIVNRVRNLGNMGSRALGNYADGVPTGVADFARGAKDTAKATADAAAKAVRDKYQAVRPAVQAKYDSVLPNVQAQYGAMQPKLDAARKFVTDNPAKAIGAGLGGTALAAGAYGATQIPGAIERGIQGAGTQMLQSPEVQQRLQGFDDMMGRGHAMLDQGQRTFANVNSAVAPFVGQNGQSNILGGLMSTLGLGGEGGPSLGGLGSQLGGFLRENPEMAARGLLGLLGAGGGYMAGGGRGAALGGLSLPLMHYLAQQYGGEMPDYLSQFTNNPQIAANRAQDDAAIAAQQQQPAAPVAPQENEIQRQQQQQS